MGYCYDQNNRLCCDICGNAGEVRKIKCPVNWCPPIAACPACRAAKKHGGNAPLVKAHPFRAHLVGKTIFVVDREGFKVEVRYAGTVNNRTVTAYVDGWGCIGGWQYPHRAMPWAYLVDSINKGICYDRMEDLPKRYQKP